jgi:NADP-dependent 3-hydroxy acid dehydrogenase YdfG
MQNPRLVGLFRLFGGPVLQDHTRKVTGSSPVSPIFRKSADRRELRTCLRRAVLEGYAIPADSFARAVAFAMSQPEDVDINEILYRPTQQVL